MKELTQEQIDRYNREIKLFLNSTTSDYCYDVLFHDLQGWEQLMNTYVKLCKTLPHNFCDIQKDKVYANGYIDLPLQQALFYVVGKTCEEHNNNSSK